MDSAPIFRSVQLSSPLTSRLMTAVGTLKFAIAIRMLYTWLCVSLRRSYKICPSSGSAQELQNMRGRKHCRTLIQRVLTNLRYDIFALILSIVFGRTGGSLLLVKWGQHLAVSVDGTGTDRDRHRGGQLDRL